MQPVTRHWVRKAEEDHRMAARAAAPPTQTNSVCYHCQQSAEKYLKALLAEAGRPAPADARL